MTLTNPGRPGSLGRLGVRLLNRSTRSLSPTEKGAVSLLLENTPYRGAYDFAERDLDLVLCFPTVRGSSVVEREIATLDWVLCASPDYLARGGRPQTPADLGDHACLVHADVAPNDSVWRFEGPKGAVAVKVRGAFFSNSVLTLRKAAVAGLGVTMVPCYAVAEDLAAGAPVTVLPRYRIAARPLLAVYPQTSAVPRKVQAFIEFLTAWMAEQEIGRRPARIAAAQ